MYIVYLETFFDDDETDCGDGEVNEMCYMNHKEIEGWYCSCRFKDVIRTDENGNEYEDLQELTSGIHPNLGYFY